jgi:hypothetical protein
MNFTIKYNRTTNHIAGIHPQDAKTGEFNYAENACGSITRYALAAGKRYDNIFDALNNGFTGGRKLCKTCEKAAFALIAAMDAAEAAEAAEAAVEVEPVVEPAPAVAPVVEDDQTDAIDNGMTTWAHGLLGAEEALQERIDANGGVWDLPAVFDLEGNMVPARRVEGEYGTSWRILDENGQGVGWFNPSKAKKEETRRANDAKRGYYLGKVSVPVKAELAGGNMFSVMPIVVPVDEKYAADTTATVADNGQPVVEVEPVVEAAPKSAYAVAFEEARALGHDHAEAADYAATKVKHNAHGEKVEKVAKKRTTKVVHPDGSESTRSSETRDYLFAVVVTENRHEVAYDLEEEWTEAVEKRDHFEESAKAPKVKKVRDKKWTRGEKFTFYLIGDPDVSGDCWWLGSEYEGDEPFDLDSALARKAEELQYRVDKLAAKIAELLDGPEIGYGVVRWSSTYPAAQTGMREFERSVGKHRTYRIVECDVV